MSCKGGTRISRLGHELHGRNTSFKARTLISRAGREFPEWRTNVKDGTLHVVQFQRWEKLKKIEKILRENDIYYENIGFTQNEFLEIEGELKISTKDLFKINNEWYNNY